MSFTVFIRSEAELDLEDAQDWYEEQRLGLGSEFRDEVGRQLERICENPSLYPVVYRGHRRAVLRRFPYLLYYSVEKESVIVVACLHGRRHPDRAKTRVVGSGGI